MLSKEECLVMEKEQEVAEELTPQSSEEQQAEVWKQLGNPELESPSTVWISEVSFPLGDTAVEPEAEYVREIIAGISKERVLNRILAIVAHDDVLKRTGFDLEERTDGIEILKDFFSHPDRNLYISLVPLI